MRNMTTINVETTEIDPVDYVKSYFSNLNENDVSILVGSIILLKEVKFRLLQSLLDLTKMEIEENIGRLLQTDFLIGEFTKNSFKLKKVNYPILKQQPNLTIDDRVLMAYLKARHIVSFDEIEKAFSLKYEAVINILSGFTVRGLIETDIIDEYQFKTTVLYKLPKKEIDDISILEKKVVGYVMLKGSTTINEITMDLEVPEHKVQSTLVDLILSDMISCSFSVKKSSLYVKIERFLLNFSTRSIDIMSSDERLIIGLVSLRKEQSIKELFEFVKSPEATIYSIISRLTSTKEFEFALMSKNIIKPLNPPIFPTVKSIDELSIGSLFNYRVLFGMISTQKQVKVSVLAQKMSVPKRDILIGIVDFYLSGLIVGFLKNMNTLIIERTRKPERRSEVALEPWERIIMGALISEGVLTWPKIASLLEIDRDTAREKAYAFITRGIGNTIAKDTALTLRAIPKLPPLTQITDLPLIDQQMFGFLVGRQNPSLKDIRSIFSISSIQAFQKIYMLCGSGLFIAKRHKRTFSIIQPKIAKPTVPIRDLNLNYQLITKEIEEYKQLPAKISNRSLAKKLDIHTNDVIKNISVLIALGYYQGSLTSKSFTKTRVIFKVKEPPKCFSCNIILLNYRKPCPECNAVPPICSVCKGAMSSADDLVACPFCRHEAHPSHILEWLKIKGECPVCRKRLRPPQLVKITYEASE